MLTVGITGPTGAGKTTALRAIEALGGAVFDCDAVYRELLESSAPLLAAIDARFPGVVREGGLDRAALARRVFSDPAALDDLSAITHPYVAREVKGRLERAGRAGCPIAAVDAIGLFESGLSAICDVTVFVTAPESARAERIMARDGISLDDAMARIRSQNGDEYFRVRADHELVNSFSDSGEFYQSCLDFFRRLYHERA